MANVNVISRLVGLKLRIKQKTKPKTIERNQNDLVLSWDNFFECDTNTDKFILQIKNNIKEWVTIYWGPKTRFRVENLEPCNCYDFRLKLQSDTTNDWYQFRGATSEGPYLVMHMSRAIKLGNSTAVRKIIQTCPHLLETENKEHKTPLIQAIENWDLQMVHFLHSLGVNVNKRLFYSKRTPLMVAISKGYLQIAQFLINKRADIHCVDINGLNILHYAVDSNNIDNVIFVLKSGVNINLQDRSGWTPLMRAVILQSSEEIINMLLENGAEVNIHDNNGFTYEKLRNL
ncbi:fibronectin type 3 and ankyrin repeat domains 1 protein [Aethina tumida]|uniref:fibronectin type 3 and ankyrin repeat domains 1 protein n=1 Tax=Aethina tumida TaxID=116153 RepID=UPI0021480085|nr:fibronectin type 3 and ankyrin repeat domains 1 protein [Aethina tumida]